MALSGNPVVLGGPASARAGAGVISPDGISATQVAYGSGTNQIKGEAAFVYVEASDRLQIGTASGTRLLLGTGTDSSNGALQLASHTASTGGIGFGTDTSLYRASAGLLSLDLPNGTLRTNWVTSAAGASLTFQTNAGTTAVAFDTSQFMLKSVGGNGQTLNIKHLTELTTIAAAATTSTTIQIPANAIVVGVSARVTVAIPTAATFDYGVSGATDRYGNDIAVAANTTHPGLNDSTRFYAGAVSILVTPNATPADNTGRVRFTIMYIDATPPTS